MTADSRERSARLLGDRLLRALLRSGLLGGRLLGGGLLGRRLAGGRLATRGRLGGAQLSPWWTSWGRASWAQLSGRPARPRSHPRRSRRTRPLWAPRRART